MVKSIELLYNGDSEECKERFKNYLEQVAASDDSALRKFFKGVLQKMVEDHSATFSSSNIVEIKDKLWRESNASLIIKMGEVPHWMRAARAISHVNTKNWKAICAWSFRLMYVVGSC